ncbi:hypothetical protein FBEOM_9119 [Fusarium beomiforme]|uniref:Uncharacterized protein n=1 Tax=Fusarium beomiforme TaxID=44412 RepID=A0A9P5DTV1_9HYPO|nr:hypothetical protein FBEOM_9119 [Fusarium beomiforme]
MYYGSDATVGVGAITIQIPSPSEPLGQFSILVTIFPVPDLDTALTTFLVAMSSYEALLRRTYVAQHWDATQLEIEYVCTGVAPGHPNLSAHFARFEEFSEDLNPANHSDVAGYRFLKYRGKGL